MTNDEKRPDPKFRIRGGSDGLWAEFEFETDAEAEFDAAPEVADATIVFVPPDDTRFHRKDCPLIGEGARPMTRDEARIVKGLGPCPVCNSDLDP